MNFNDIFFNNDNNNDDFDFECKSSYPLFNFDALRNSQINDCPLNLISAQKASDIVDEILYKKVKNSNNTSTIVTKKRGRKAIAKDAKQYDDPSITIQEIIDNDLAGTPMTSEIKAKEQRLKKIQDKKAQRKAAKGATDDITAIENLAPIAITTPAFTLDPVIFDNNTSFAPQVIFRDGKVVIDNSALAIRDEKKLTVVEAKPYKLTSMSFRTKNNTAKWTVDETKKFFKGIEIFGADFSLIAKLFPSRNRDQIKNKFNKEEKINATRMNEAFKRNSLLGKRSIMDRMRAFSTSLETEPAAIAAGEFDIEIGGIKALERQYSNTSTDSMDLKIIDEIRDIFINEIRPRNTTSTSTSFLTANNTIAVADRSFGFSDPQNVTRDFNIVETEQNRPQEIAPAKTENLFLKLIK